LDFLDRVDGAAVRIDSLSAYRRLFWTQSLTPAWRAGTPYAPRRCLDCFSRRPDRPVRWFPHLRRHRCPGGNGSARVARQPKAWS